MDIDIVYKKGFSLPFDNRLGPVDSNIANSVMLDAFMSKVEPTNLTVTHTLHSGPGGHFLLALLYQLELRNMNFDMPQPMSEAQGVITHYLDDEETSRLYAALFCIRSTNDVPPIDESALALFGTPVGHPHIEVDSYFDSLPKIKAIFKGWLDTRSFDNPFASLELRFYR